jgi:hypothetical protein
VNDHDECDHEHDGMYDGALPNWRFSLWDVAGIALHTLAGATVQVGNGLGLLAREFAAQANRSRQNFDLREAQRLNEAARREMSQAAEAILGLPEIGEPS